MKENKFFRNNNPGITLAELLVSVVIMGFMMLGVSTFFSRGIDFFRVTEAKVSVQRDARHCLETMNRYLRQAKATSVVLKRYNTSQPPYSMVEFKTIKGDTIKYYQNITSLYQEVTNVNGYTHRNLLSDNLQSLAFAYPQTTDSTLLHISICLVKIPHPYIKGAKALQLSVEKVRIMN